MVRFIPLGQVVKIGVLGIIKGSESLLTTHTHENIHTYTHRHTSMNTHPLKHTQTHTHTDTHP